ncbi:MAG: hypothetical protein HYW90_00380 [Candidatus Sungbacteria bacterium]|nr:hypothetical protein [Candidatus Sungbacteria bacterium]
MALRTFGIRPKKVENLEVAEGFTGRKLRRTTFMAPRKRSTSGFNAKQLGNMQMLVVEEYLAVDDHDDDGISRVAIEVYPYGHRPNLEGRCTIAD